MNTFFTFHSLVFIPNQEFGCLGMEFCPSGRIQTIVWGPRAPTSRFKTLGMVLKSLKHYSSRPCSILESYWRIKEDINVTDSKQSCVWHLYQSALKKKSITKLGVAAIGTAHWVKAPTTKPDELGSVLGIHKVEGEI